MSSLCCGAEIELEGVGEILGVMRRLGWKCMSKDAGSLTIAVKKDDGCCWEEVAS